jgi:hypothetical protein
MTSIRTPVHPTFIFLFLHMLVFLFYFVSDMGPLQFVFIRDLILNSKNFKGTSRIQAWKF